MIEVAWDKKKVIKGGLARGTRYAVYSIHADGTRYFYGWCLRSEIKNILAREKEENEKLRKNSRD